MVQPLNLDGTNRGVAVVALDSVDAGIGDKLTEKEARNYDIVPGPTLMDGLIESGVSPADVDTVILTHLHLDHTGWLTTRDSHGHPQPTFQNARHVIQRTEWAAAHDTNELTVGSYRRADFDPLESGGLVEWVTGDVRLTPCVSVHLTGAHSPGHQIVTVSSDGQTLVCPSELVSTIWHLRVAWAMSYDLEPLKVVEQKRALLSQAAAEGHVLFLNHDPAFAFGQVDRLSEREYGWKPLLVG